MVNPAVIFLVLDNCFTKVYVEQNVFKNICGSFELYVIQSIYGMKKSLLIFSHLDVIYECL